jgi:hypothetical protein
MWHLIPLLTYFVSKKRVSLYYEWIMSEVDNLPSEIGVNNTLDGFL